MTNSELHQLLRTAAGPRPISLATRSRLEQAALEMIRAHPAAKHHPYDSRLRLLDNEPNQSNSHDL